MKKIPSFMCWIFVFASFSSVTFAESADAFFQDSLGDYREELEIAAEEGKLGIFLFFEQDECPFCHRMKTTILNLKPVQDWYHKYFKTFAIDIEGDTEMVDFSGNTMIAKDFAFKHNRVRATPVMVFIGLDGKKMVRYTGATSSKEEFLWLGEFVVNGDYKNSSFTRYKRDRRSREQR